MVEVDGGCSPSGGCSATVGGSGSVAIGVAWGGMEVRAASWISASVVSGGVGGPVILSPVRWVVVDEDEGERTSGAGRALVVDQEPEDSEADSR